jgi:uncharacterized membrane protein
MFIFVILAYLALIIYEFIPLYNEKHWGDFALNAFLALTSFTAALLLSLDIKISSPEYAIREFIQLIIGK